MYSLYSETGSNFVGLFDVRVFSSRIDVLGKIARERREWVVPVERFKGIKTRLALYLEVLRSVYIEDVFLKDSEEYLCSKNFEKYEIRILLNLRGEGFIGEEYKN